MSRVEYHVYLSFHSLSNGCLLSSPNESVSNQYIEEVFSEVLGDSKISYEPKKDPKINSNSINNDVGKYKKPRTYLMKYQMRILEWYFWNVSPYPSHLDMDSLCNETHLDTKVIKVCGLINVISLFFL